VPWAFSEPFAVGSIISIPSALASRSSDLMIVSFIRLLLDISKQQHQQQQKSTKRSTTLACQRKEALLPERSIGECLP